MFDSSFRIFWGSRSGQRQSFAGMIDAEIWGDDPAQIEQPLGSLRLRSRTLLLSDPQHLPSVAIPNFPTDEVAILAGLRESPSGQSTITKLTVRATTTLAVNSRRKIATLPVDSGRVVVADKLDIDEYWTQTGKDRIGVVPTNGGDALLRFLKNRFKLRTVQVNDIRAELVEPVSEQLEQEIEACLKSVPKYAQFPFLHFRVQTNNSFDRVNFMQNAWDFLPIGNAETPHMFACDTRFAGVTYDVICDFAGGTPVTVAIRFNQEDE